MLKYCWSIPLRNIPTSQPDAASSRLYSDTKQCSNAEFHAIRKSHWWYPLWQWCSWHFWSIKFYLSTSCIATLGNSTGEHRAAAGLYSCSGTHLGSWKSQAGAPQSSLSQYRCQKLLGHQNSRNMYVGRYQTNLFLSQSLKFGLNRQFGPRFACYLGSKLKSVCHRLGQVYAGNHHMYQIFLQNCHVSQMFGVNCHKSQKNHHMGQMIVQN